MSEPSSKRPKGNASMLGFSPRQRFLPATIEILATALHSPKCYYHFFSDRGCVYSDRNPHSGLFPSNRRVQDRV
ncbi:uncharacterized protein [Blastocystis hominis]|uniref:Uncharacterized protein n=1 Tax=Blastocystis hominis TaxID=12968 RepID=D8M9D8_BLAHO|nr:uncharacterized protein [Blastocystis hominis]CBK24677.2 unnamed protein product [Blastocystis hominis]|eukprot:XP_012898725.1 uncharacterized protein [Blastocystis hominis]